MSKANECPKRMPHKKQTKRLDKENNAKCQAIERVVHSNNDNEASLPSNSSDVIIFDKKDEIPIDYESLYNWMKGMAAKALQEVIGDSGIREARSEAWETLEVLSRIRYDEKEDLCMPLKILWYLLERNHQIKTTRRGLAQELAVSYYSVKQNRRYQKLFNGIVWKSLRALEKAHLIAMSINGKQIELQLNDKNYHIERLKKMMFDYKSLELRNSS